jgi:hypothetical protein
MRKGCIVMLAFGFEDLAKYNKTMLVRNKSVRDYMYSGALEEDVIIFHEGNILDNHQTYIQSATPDMPIRFENISAVFKDFRVVHNTLCPPSILSDQKNTPPGYNSMCYFWFVAFRDYVKDYDWLIRIDDDCVLYRDVRNNIQLLHNTSLHFASPSWLDLSRGHQSKYDRISEKAGGPEGIVVRGLRKLTVAFAKRHNYSRPIKSWKAPYTNVMYVDLNWLRNSTIISSFTQAVVDTGCIYGNRWGDMPLWGAALLLAHEPQSQFVFPYYHGSHNTYVSRMLDENITTTV